MTLSRAVSSKKTRPPKLPQLLDRKLYKTGQTRGATNKEIYQNRVSRSSTVLIPWSQWEMCQFPDGEPGTKYENGFIVLVPPTWYFETPNAKGILASEGVRLGENALLLFQQRADWVRYGPDSTNSFEFKLPVDRLAPIGGNYMARIHSTTAVKDGKGFELGYNTTGLRGAGIRVYEYASTKNITLTRVQLEALVWMCTDATEVLVEAGMSASDAFTRRQKALQDANTRGLLDFQRLQMVRLINGAHNTVCPLCFEEVSASGFLSRTEQAEGREVYDLTTTELSLFHIEELRVGTLQHKPYNLGWGHHHCNVVVKDAGIIPSLKWMKSVVDRNAGTWEEIEHAEELIEEATDPV
ncbi:BstXI family restriction endonuclease [Dietzia cinnamea]|uniref:BstXI family restriction endonuclease n=1 Tax=Dietzia cinnamea TaxID=321318 RepID=UPI00223BD371|nr:BstXI family restriction endonuclease [Dietzia cinnamea]MCT2077678.1 BstXI family restriction endonuclease [Dietzia cinnamea]MCT2221961.1 BstXI family restriction endonuclease [Dietzia cinnamea]